MRFQKQPDFVTLLLEPLVEGVGACRKVLWRLIRAASGRQPRATVRGGRVVVGVRVAVVSGVVVVPGAVVARGGTREAQRTRQLQVDVAVAV